MTRMIAAAAGLLLSLAFTGSALANGATAEFKAGGVVFKHNKDISIVREDLETRSRSDPRPLRLSFRRPPAGPADDGLSDGEDLLR